MAIWMRRSLRKPSGGRIRRHAGKKRREISREIIPLVVGEKRIKRIRTFGGNEKTRVFKADTINVSDPESGKTVVAKIKTVVENPANPHYVRRNIITHGALVQTDMGDVRVTSRPGQDGTLNGVLVK
ncbi:MAG: 30S ribosomal protein S8e [Candidatus Thermoplasmatota archaeon]|nr:30S ribosomal protein S8e [Candidatus Thermoplasmatota archaeon]